MRKDGSIQLFRLLEVLNRLPTNTRLLVLGELKECDPRTRYFVLSNGRVDAVPV